MLVWTVAGIPHSDELKSMLNIFCTKYSRLCAE